MTTKDINKIENSIKILFLKGVSTKDIAIKVGIHPTTVIRRMKKIGLDTTLSRNIIRPFSDYKNKSIRDYWLGFLLADGYVINYQLGLTLSAVDKNHIVKYAKFVNRDVKEYNYAFKSCRVIYHNKKELNYLKSIGLRPNKTFSGALTFITWDVLRGIFDGDGHFNKWTMTINTSSKDTVKLITNFIVDEGYNCKVRIDPPFTKKGLTKRHFIISIPTYTQISILNKLIPLGCIKLERKYKKLRVLIEKSMNKNRVNSGELQQWTILSQAI